MFEWEPEDIRLCLNYTKQGLVNAWGPGIYTQVWFHTYSRYDFRLELVVKACESPQAAIAKILEQKISRHGAAACATERQLLACHWILMKITPMAKGHKIILKSEITHTILGNVRETL